jgi:PIN like domain
VPPPAPQPRFFLDRSLGRIAVPALLRAAGWDLVTLSEHYGIPDDEHISDIEWIGVAAGRGWAILTLAFHRDAELTGASTVKGAPELGR